MTWPDSSLKWKLRRWTMTHPVAKTRCEDYEYQPLEGDGDRSVRLMLLLPATNKNDPLVCHLVERPITDSVYEALSYVWGDASEKKLIYCVLPDADHHGKLGITHNLDEALRALRWKFSMRTLWVDAVCINQENLLEKSNQIPLMAQVYSKASQTIIWLGEEDASTRRLFQLYWVEYHLSMISVFASEVADKHLRKNKDDLLRRAHRALGSHPWFQRIWTLQEFVLSKKLSVVCGARSISWNHFSSYVSLSTGWGAPWRTLRKSCLEDLTSADLELRYHTLLPSIKLLRATEPRDKVFGTISILEAVGLRLTPLDYSMSVQDVFIAATRSWLRHSQSLALIFYAATGRTTQRIPSWTIDWAHATMTDDYMMHRYVKESIDAERKIPEDEFMSPGKALFACDNRAWDDPHLDAQAHLLDEVSECAAGYQEEADEEEFEHAMTRWLYFLSAKSVPGKTPTAAQQMAFIARRAKWYTSWDSVTVEIGEKVLRYLLALVDRSNQSTRSDVSRLMKIEAEWNDEWRDDIKSHGFSPLDVTRVKQILEQRSRHENLFMTKNGRLGHCFCQDLKVGDQIGFLGGSYFPVVLRPTSEAGQYLFVGPATVYGLLDRVGEHELILDMTAWPKDPRDWVDIVLV